MSEAGSTFRSAVWNHAGKILEYALMFLISVVVARALGVQENGVFAGLISFSQLLLVASSFGLEISLNKHIPQISSPDTLEKTRNIVRKALLLRCVLFAAVAACVSIASELKPALLPFQARSYLSLLIVYAGLRSLIPVFAVVLTAQLQTALTARINLAIRIVELLLVVIVSRRGLLVDRLLIVFICTGCLHIGAYALFSRTNWLGRARKMSAAPIIAFGGVFWINSIVDYFLGRQGDVLFLTGLLTDASQASLYDVAYSMMQIAALGMTVGLSGVALATFARLVVSSVAAANRFYDFLVRVTSLLTIPVYAFLAFNAVPLVTSLYSPAYIEAAGLLQGMVVFRIVGRLFAGGENADYLLSMGRVGTLVALGGVAAFVNVGLNLLLIPHLQAEGSVIASGSANLLVNLLGVVVVLRLVKGILQVRFWLVLSSISLLASWGCSLLITPQTAPGWLVLAGLYSIMILIAIRIMRPLTFGDLEWLSRAVPRIAGWFVQFSRPVRAQVRTRTQ